MAKAKKEINKTWDKMMQAKLPVWGKTLVLAVFGGLLIFSAYHAYFANKIIPGVRVADIKLGGMTATEALKVLENPFEKEYTLVLKDSEESAVYEIKTQNLELEYDAESTVKAAFNAGRTGNFLVDLKTKLAGLIKPQPIKAASDFNTNLLEQRLSEIKGLVDQPSVNARFYLDEEENVQIQKDQVGRKINSNALYRLVLQSFENLEYSEKELPVVVEEADILASDLQGLKADVEILARNDLTVTHNENAWEITPKEKLEYVSVAKTDGDLGEGELSLKLNTKTFESYLERLAEKVNVLPRGLVTEETEEGQVLEFEIIEEGEELDIKAFTEDFKEALFENKEKVAVTTIPTNNSSDLTKYGIFALLGRGESDYSGSGASRVHNLTLAAERASGVLVPPGETYSLNQAVGAISGATGYNSAWIISNGRTILGAGGGVCQTSTTLFRAVLNSGLPVVERHPHAYRVSYYEQDKPVGFDASIYQPALDFRFKNDTPNYVLVQAESMPEESKLAFNIYGTPDGREVEITDPEITGVTGAPAPLYEETDTLAKGVTRQIDFAAPGGTSVFSRTVSKDEEVLFEETYKSVYRPWRAVFLVGTAE
ncbi:hypothetical protein GF360_01555 [candidate division WWE3 bacterium]|nr:hypothetical protein [candidate division WWE3 bacterium]